MNVRRFGVTLIIITAMLASASPAAEQDLDQAIQKHRMGTLVIKARPGAQVQVEQMRHAFWFGAALSSGAFGDRLSAKDKQHYREIFLANFNAAVTENAVKWQSMERRQGQVNHATVEAMLDWTKAHAIPLRGHCLFWGIPGRVQDWLKQMDDDTLRQKIQDRAISMGRRYRGRIAEYDLNNEMIHGNYYAQRLGPGITKQMADWVRQGDPQARLFVNDYDVLTGRRLPDYVTHIQTLLQQDVPISGIGVQGHLHGDSFDPNALQQALDTLAKIGLPIRVTEFNMPGQRSRFYRKRHLKLTPAEEEAKAKDLVEYYRICFAHPAVHGILMWGFWEGANWIPQSSLYRRDWTPTPAAQAYRDLVFKQWWTKWEGRADDQGRCELRAFYGKHRVTVAGQDRVVDLSRETRKATVSF